MKASERLRELDLAPFAFVEDQSGQVAVAIEESRFKNFQRALPLIVDVVEAAENLPHREGWRIQQQISLDTALTALCDALQPEPHPSWIEKFKNIEPAGSPPPPEGGTAP